MPAPLLQPDAGPDPLHPGYADSVRAALLGGALGDALGAAARPAAPAGTADDAGQLRISSTTQLTLGTLDGLLEVLEWAADGLAADGTACLWLSYLRWLRGQDGTLPAEAPQPPSRPLEDHPVLLERRGPAGTALAALRTGRMGEVRRPVLPGAGDAGSVPRSAPLGLLPHVGWRTLAQLAVDGAALTHGEAEEQSAAAVHAFTVQAAVRARQEGLALPVAAAVEAARAAAGRLTRPAGTTRRLLDEAVTGTGAAAGPPPGDGDAAPAVLAAGLRSALEAERRADGPQDAWRRAVAAASRTGSPSAAGAVAGTVLAAAHGTAALPPDLLARLDAREAVEDLAGRWLRTVGAAPAV
ncbi:ADP-ribosylglycohydrolase family protein [Kocuria flava]|uniref:ADP-ribosylglycohydrolase family protein n=1 Tax=Kocuria flava TaxID=446860 RepID=UPI001FF3C2B9|nr:ADP-ribosylglycohydrolase family protein [Kocuria flava]MCJ8504986.1 ADP-ribosylglycohydrolase family protein [Kocuria flava]